MEEITTLEQLKSFIENLTEEQKGDNVTQALIATHIATFFKLVMEKSVIVANSKSSNGLTRDQRTLDELKYLSNSLKECSDKFSAMPLNDPIKEAFAGIKPQIDEVALGNAGMANINAQMASILRDAEEKRRQQSSGCFGVFIFLLGLSGGLLYLLIH